MNRNMKLIGMLDSPYVRRVAVSFRTLGISFEHQSVSVFRHFDEFSGLNPVVKAPTLICEDGTVLMDSSLILDYADRLAPVGRLLVPRDPAACRRVLRVVGLALAACEKSISIIYERQLRPAQKQHQPWIERVTGQLLAACSALELELGDRPLAVKPETLEQDAITAAVTWSFLQLMIPEIVIAANHPRWRGLADDAESLTAFAMFPQQ